MEYRLCNLFKMGILCMDDDLFHLRRQGLFKEFVSFVNDEGGVPIYENTMQYAILKKEWILKQ